MSSLNKIARMIAAPISQHIEAAVMRAMSSHRQQMHDLMILQGRALALKNADRSLLVRLQDAKFKVFSQFCCRDSGPLGLDFGANSLFQKNCSYSVQAV